MSEERLPDNDATEDLKLVVQLAEQRQAVTDWNQDRISRRIMEAALASPLMGICLADMEGRVVYMNPAALRLLGYDSVEEVKGAPAIQFWREEGRQGEILKVLLEEGLWSGEATALRKDRSSIHVQAMQSVVKDEAGNKLGIICSFLDLTERDRLMAVVAQSAKLAAVGQLAAGVAHEINNPAAFVMTNLGQITEFVGKIIALLDEARQAVEAAGSPELRGRVRALEEKFDVEYLRRELEEMVNESLEGMVRIRNVVSDLRKFARWEETETEEIDLNHLVKSVLKLAQNRIRFRGVVEENYGELPVFRGIQGRLASAVMNVVLNAAEALDPAEVSTNRIRIATGMQKGRIFIRVGDNGPGMDAETLKRVFDPFFTTKSGTQNRGLGLTIAQDMVVRNGGEITVESVPGKGSLFCIWLPGPGQDPGEPKVPVYGPAPQPHRPRLLIIDDELSILKALNRLLGAKYEITSALSALQALDILQHDPHYDLLLCDLLMPEHDGMFFYNQTIQKWPELEPRFLFFTGGVGDSEKLKEFYHLMIDRTLHKPFTPDEIFQMIENQLRRSP